MQYIEHPTETGFYWFKRPPYIKGFWWQKKTKIVPGWEMCFVNKAGMSGNFAVIVGAGTKLISFKADVEWFGPIQEPEELNELIEDQAFLKQRQEANLERARSD